MMDAELELIARDDAVHLLDDLFAGVAKNEFGIPYRDLGLPLRCALEVARRLGTKAKPLESHLRRELRSGHFVAAMALGSLGNLEIESVEDLALALGSDDFDLSCESAVALLKSGKADHPAVLAVQLNSASAARALARVKGVT